MLSNRNVYHPVTATILIDQDMNNSELNTEQIILEAAEAEFLEKGYGNAKVMSIAKRAGVSHSMLHYYFRNKETLFQKIFVKKIQKIGTLFNDIFDQHLPLADTIRLFVETQFDFVAENPRLPQFIINEISANKDNRDMLFELLEPKLADISIKLGARLDDEAKKGNIRPVRTFDLLMDIIAMNVSTFVVMPIMQDMSPDKSQEYFERFLSERKKSNVQFVLDALRP